MLKSIRGQVLEERFLPVYNEAMAITDEYERTDGKKMPVAKDFMRQLKERFVDRKNNDEKHDSVILRVGGFELKASTATRALMHGMQKFILVYRFSTSPKVFLSNEFNNLRNSLASTLANVGIDRADKSTFVPESKEMGQAIMEFGRDPAKTMALGRTFHFINRSEQSMLQSPVLNVSERRNTMQQAYGFMLETFADAMPRVHGMIMTMLKNGAWEAYSVDKKSGELVYDKTKDKRYYNLDGTQTPQQKALWEGLINRLKDQGVMKAGDTEPNRGDDWEIVNNQYKWYASQFIYPAMDDMSRILAPNVFLGSMFSQYRMFLPNMFTNLFGKKGKTIGGSEIKAVQLPNGEWTTAREEREIEGQTKSWGAALKAIYEAKGDPSQVLSWYKGQPDARRINLMRSMINATVMAGLAALILGLPKKDEERFSYLWNELMVGYAAEGWMKSPIPLMSNIVNINQVVLGQKNFNALLRMSGPIGGAYRVGKTIGAVK